jgi:hypothetical protein
MGGAVCSAAAGHGRNWSQGAVTGCYGPLLLGTREIQSKVTPMLEVRHGEGDPKLLENLLTLVRPPVIGSGSVCFYNSGDRLLSFSWRIDSAEWNELAMQPGEMKDILL